MLKVNLGAGLQAYEHLGYVNVDIIKSEGIDYEWNLNDGLPRNTWVKQGGVYVTSPDYKVFQDSTVDEFLCKHFLEHLTHEGFMRLMDEMWDALVKPNGILHVQVPNGAHVRAAHSDPTHRLVFTEWTFDYFTKETLAAYPYTKKPWLILNGYPKINGTPPDDLWEIEWILQPDVTSAALG